jgi:hypothetical protein
MTTSIIFHVLVCAFNVYIPATLILEMCGSPYPASVLVHGLVMLTCASMHAPVRLPAKSHPDLKINSFSISDLAPTGPYALFEIASFVLRRRLWIVHMADSFSTFWCVLFMFISQQLPVWNVRTYRILRQLSFMVKSTPKYG